MEEDAVVGGREDQLQGHAVGLCLEQRPVGPILQQLQAAEGVDVLRGGEGAALGVVAAVFLGEIVLSPGRGAPPHSRRNGPDSRPLSGAP